MKSNLHIIIWATGLIFFLFAGNHLTAQTNWVKYEGNPVFEEFGTWSSVGAPCVMYENSIFKMWFTGGGNIGYAESTDGITWIPEDEPIIEGTPGEWDEDIGHPCVIRVNDTLRMWFSGSSDGFWWEISIGYAWSVDNIDWYVLPDPVLEKGEPGSWDENAVYKPSVLYNGTTYQMWYNGFEGSEMTDPDRVGYATSSDGINWVKDTDHNPVMDIGENGTFYDTWVQSSCVLFLDNEFKMWFAGYDATNITPLKYYRIGYATSPDGIEWTVQNDSAILDHGLAGAWDESRVYAPSVLYHESQYKMWYAGFNYYTHRIGYAECLGTGIYEKYDSKDISISPNPFTGYLTITYTLKERSQICLEIFNHQGKQVTTLVDGNLQKGEQKITFDGASLPSGVYFCVLKTREGIETKKIIKLD